MTVRDRPRERLFQTAARLFHQHGYRAVGVDAIAAEAGIGKMTLYRHFPSKDDLIVAYLRASDEGFWKYFERVTGDATTAREILLAFFTALQSYTSSPHCYGCPFLHIAAEYPESDHIGHQIAVEHKQAVRTHFQHLAQAAGAERPATLADALLLLMDGVYMAARMFGSSPASPALNVAEAARILIDAYCAP